jgi:LPXTG-motif cell wall-anchored protein
VGKRWAALVLIAAASLAALGGLGAPAGAGVSRTFSCSFSVSPTTLPPGGGTVTLSGVAPGSTVVRVFLDGQLAATTTSAPVTGEWSVQVRITSSVEISVALDDYPETPCIGVGDENVGRNPQPGTIIVGGRTATRLALTGSSDTRPFVLIGLGAVCVGLVLVVAARRRSRVHGRG